MSHSGSAGMEKIRGLEEKGEKEGGERGEKMPFCLFTNVQYGRGTGNGGVLWFEGEGNTTGVVEGATGK